MSATAVGSSTTSWRPGGSSTGSLPRACLGRGAPSERGTIQLAEGERGVAGDPVGPVVAGDARQTTLGGFAGHHVTGRVGEAPRPVVGAAEARRLETVGTVDERPHHSGPVGRGRLRGRRGGCSRLTAAHQAGSRPGHPGSRGATLTASVARSTSARSPDVVDHGGRPRCRAAVVVDPHAYRRRVLGHVLVDHRVGEAGQRRPMAVGGRLDLDPGQPGHDLFHGRRCEILLGGHARTPTRTLRKRAGAAG